MKAIAKMILIGCLAISFNISNVNAQDDVRSLRSFDEIVITGRIEVELQQGEEGKAEVYTRNVSPDNVTIEINRGILKLGRFNTLWKKDEDVRIVITYKQLRSIKAHAGAKVNAKSIIEGDKLKIRSNSGAEMELELQMKALDATVSEGATLELSGQVETQEVKAFTGGQYKGFDLQCKHTYVTSNTGGEARVVALESLEAKGNTGGSIRYKGDPEEKHTKTILAGDIARW